MRKLFGLLLAFGLVYGVVALWDASTAYFAIRHGAHRVAVLAKNGPVPSARMRRVLDDIYTTCGIELYSTDISVERDSESVTISIRAMLPIDLPLLERRVEREVVISVTELSRDRGAR